VVTHEQGTPGQPSTVPDPFMSTVTAQPVLLSSESAPPSSGTSAERARSTQAHALSTDPNGTGHDDADVNHDVGTGNVIVNYKPLQNVPEDDDENYNGPPSRKTTATRTSTTGTNPDDGQNGGQNDGYNDGHRVAES